MLYIDTDTKAYEREDVVSVLVPSGEEDFEAQEIEIDLDDGSEDEPEDPEEDES